MTRTRRRPTCPWPTPAARLAAAALLACAFSLLATTNAAAQGWDDDDSWNDSGANNYGSSQDLPWYLRAGLGFTEDPDDLLINLELGYQFDRYVSVGPMVQIGVADDRSIVAPTANVTLTIPDMPGEALDAFKPFLFAGVGFAVLEDGGRRARADRRQTGFLVNTGAGVDYQINEQFAVGTRMIVNFLPGRTLNEDEFFAWEIIGFKLAF